MRSLIIPFLLFSFAGYAQCKSSTVSPKGEVLNCIDQKDLKQGKWVSKIDGVRGEPGYEEEGIYKDGKKEGIWRVYTLMGDLYAVENYRWGNKDGRNQYFNIAGIVREENWKAVNPANPYDTVEVPDPLDPYKVQMKVVKIEGSSVKHGTWKYYEGGTSSLIKTDTYFLDKLQDPNAVFLATGEKPPVDSTKKIATASDKKAKPQAVIDFEKKLGKKGKKVIDGKTY